MTGFQSKRASALDKLKGQGMKTAMVTTMVRQELEVPDDWTREDIYEFLANVQSFNDAFQGVSNTDQTARILDLVVVEEEITELGEEAFDAWLGNRQNI
jgi:hypothetical protein